MHFCGDWNRVERAYRDLFNVWKIPHIIISIMKSDYSLGKNVR